MKPIKIATPFIALGIYALVGIIFAAEQTSPNIGPWHSWHGHMSGFMWIFPLMMMFMFIFILFILSRGCGRWRRHDYPESRYTNDSEPGATSETALDILNKRYARGEIEKQEYEEKKATIISSNR